VGAFDGLAARVTRLLQAVLFDFDGVIADSEPLHLAGFQQALAFHDIDLDEAAYYARYVGYDDHDAFEHMLADVGRAPEPEKVAELMQAKARIFAELARERVTILPGVRELVASLRAGAAPLPLAIGSGALHGEIELILRLFSLEKEFHAIVAADDVMRSKPDPETYRKAMESLGALVPDIEPSRCIVIEDTAAGLQAGRRAGMVTIGVATTHHAASLEADLVVDSLQSVDRARCEALVRRRLEEES
jgi:beta-phosphoglucomutase